MSRGRTGIWRNGTPRISGLGHWKGGGGWHRRGWYPWWAQYPNYGYGPQWGAERILLVEPDPLKKDPCPPGFVMSATAKTCVKGKKPMSGLGDIFPLTATKVLVGGALALGAWWFLKR